MVKFHHNQPVKDVIEEYATDEISLVYILENSGVEWDKISDFPKASPIYVFNDGELNVIDPSSMYITEAQDWVNELSDYAILDYIQPIEDNFWDSVFAGQKVYHGTTTENAQRIIQDGLEPRNETRGISNRSMGDGVFTSDNIEIAKNYYDVVVEIDVSQMKSDGYIPRSGGEEPLDDNVLREVLAHKIGIEDYYVDSEHDLDPGTVVFYGVIPPKYLRII